MFINNSNCTPNFTSINSPVIKETIYSGTGIITIQEITKKDLPKVAKLFRGQQSRSVTQSLWGKGSAKIKQEREEYNSINKHDWLKDIKNYLLKFLNKPDGNSTILVARDDEKDKVIGYALMESMDNTETPTGIIKDYYVDYKYRDQGVGFHMLHKLTRSSRGIFDKIISINHAWGNYVYDDLGYHQIDSAEEKTLNRKYADGDDRVWFEKRL